MSARLATRLTDRLGLVHPILGAPMAFAAGGRLAAAVTRAGGLGLIGGAYGDDDWLETAFRDAGNASVGCGFITWNLARMGARGEALLEATLARRPRVLLLSFGDPEPFARTVLEAGSMLAVQVQRVEDARRALDCGADVIVAQGGEAGGHGEKRATMTLVPELVDLVCARAPDTLVLAAGGIADGRGLAASLALGADGVLVGSRLWASREAQVHPALQDAALAADGDATLRTRVVDIARHLPWPDRYTARVLANDFTGRWHGREDALCERADSESRRWRAALEAGDARTANAFVGEAAGLIHSVEPVEQILETMVREAVERLRAITARTDV